MRLLSITFIGCVLFGLVFFFWLSNAPNVRKAKNLTTVPSEINQSNRKEGATEDTSQLPELDEKTTDWEELPQDVARHYKLAEIGNKQEIRFFLKVLDQNETPVGGATVYFDAGGGFISGGKQGYTQTDSNGMASISVDGSYLMIEDIRHPEIEYIPSKRSSHDLFYGFQRSSRRDSNLWTSYSDASNPRIFKVWRFGSLPDLSLGCQSIIVSDNENAKAVLAINRRSSQLQEISRDTGPPVLGYEITVDTQADGAKPWTLKLFVPDGGIREAKDDKYLNAAPGHGYATELVETGTFGDLDPWLSFPPIYLRGESSYGAAQLRFLPFSPRTSYSYLRICYKVNFSNSTNLETKQTWNEPHPQ